MRHPSSQGHSRNAITGNGVVYGRNDEMTESGMLPSVVAARVLNAIESGEEEVTIVNEFKVKLGLFLRYFAPSLLFGKMKLRKPAAQM